MAQTFEQTIANMVETKLAAEQDRLMPYRRGFVLLDFNEEENRAFGVYRFRLNDADVLVPAVYRDGELSGTDIMILIDTRMFVPAVRGWITKILNSGPSVVAEMIKGSSGAPGPSSVHLYMKDFPYALKTASTELQASELTALNDAFRLDMLEPMSPEMLVRSYLAGHPSAAAVVHRAMTDDSKLMDVLTDRYGDGFVEEMKLVAADACVRDSVFRKASCPVEAPAKVQVITDMGSPEAAALSPANKRLLMQRGMFVVDHRSATETIDVFESPAQGSMQTLSAPGIYRILLADGSLEKARLVVWEDECGGDIPTCNPSPGNVYRSAPGQKLGAIFESMPDKMFRLSGKVIWGRPYMFREENSDETSRLEDVGYPISFSSAVKASKQQEKDADKSVADAVHASDKSVPVAPDIRAWDIAVIDPKNNALVISAWQANKAGEEVSINYNGQDLILAESPDYHNITFGTNQVFVPEGSRLVGVGDHLPFQLGTPGQVEKLLVRKIGVKPLQLNREGSLYSMEGAATHVAQTEKDAMLTLIYDVGMSAADASQVLGKTASSAGKGYRCLVSHRAATVLGPVNLNGMKISYPEEQIRTFNVSSAMTQKVGEVKKEKEKSKDEFDLNFLKRVVSVSDFREITAEDVRTATAAMNTAGRRLLMLLLHRPACEERFGKDDTESLITSTRQQFVNEGDLALFLRDKRGTGDIDDESVLGLLTENMG